MSKIDIPVDKRRWPLGLIPGVITLISTVDKNGEPNVAPFSWIQMVSFKPSILMFSGSKRSRTVNNVISTGSFAVNLVDSSMADTVFECIKWRGGERIERAGFEFEKARKIAAPLVKGCPAHIECELEDTRELGNGFVVFGEIVAAAVEEEILKGEAEKRYELLDMILFLEDGLWGRLGDVTRIKSRQ